MATELIPVYHKVNMLYGECKSPHKLYYSITNAAANLVNAEKCSLMLADKSTRALRVSAVTGGDRWLIENIRIRSGEGIAGRVYAEGVPIVTDCAESISKYVLCPRPRYKTPSSVILPLGIGDETIGVLSLSDKRSGTPFTEDDLSLLSVFSSHIFLILKVSSCYRELEHLRELSTTDFLTGLFNRRYFNMRLGEEHQRVKRSADMFSLVMLDIDDFKRYNDNEGHLAGDRILKQIAKVMARTIRANDILARFGGEEFAIIMPETAEATALMVAERIRREIKKIRQSGTEKFPGRKLTVSIGIAVYNDCRQPVEDVIERADLALRRAKLQGKDCAVLYDTYCRKGVNKGLSQEELRHEDTGYGSGQRSCP
ncbi:MAG: sensor domain-containing diguanylate cyclase [Thermodesulfovibrionales bacterium]